jgi:hypothetical protein
MGMTSRKKLLIGGVSSLSVCVIVVVVFLRVKYPSAFGYHTGGCALLDASLSSSAAQPVCNATDHSGCTRGLYLSLYTTVNGQITFSGNEAGVFADILGNSTKEQYLFDFISAQNITSLSLYDLPTILSSSTLKTNLVNFMSKARSQFNVSRIEAIGSELQASWDKIYAFHQNQSTFDGFVTEIEFWNNATSFSTFISTLQYIRSLSWKNSTSGNKPTLCSYLGWPTTDQVNIMAPYLDQVYLHCYVKNPLTAYNYGLNRFQMFDTANKAQNLSVKVLPIFSAEGIQYSAGAETFMGDWFQNHSIPEAESFVWSNWTSGSTVSNVTKLAGFQYFEYFFLRKYVSP